MNILFNNTNNSTNSNNDKKSDNNRNKNNIIRRCSSCSEYKDNLNDKFNLNNKNSNIMSNTNIKSKFYNNFNKTSFAGFSSSPKIKEKYTKLPLLVPEKSKKMSSKNYQRFKNYQRMKNYKIKLKKAKKEESTEDHLFKLLHEYDLHYSFSQNKYIIGDNFGYYSKYLPDKFKVNFNSTNIIQKTKNSSVSKNATHSNISSESSKKKTNLDKKKRGLFYSTTDEDDEDRMSYQKYMKLQSVADIKFRPALGDTSYDLVNYIRKIDGIRKGVVNDLINQINNVENRYNIEKPKEDSKFSTKMQGLYHHKWKNIFPLKDYQKLFSENLKGKISSKNYELMVKNFKDIFLLCFSTGNTNFSKVKSFQDE